MGIETQLQSVLEVNSCAQQYYVSIRLDKSMDAFVIGLVLNKTKEPFDGTSGTTTSTTQSNTNTDSTRKISVFKVTMFLISLFIGIYAAMLSWRCNTALGMGVLPKAIFALFAFLFGLVYLILYLILRWSDCKVLQERPSDAASAAVAPIAASSVAQPATDLEQPTATADTKWEINDETTASNNVPMRGGAKGSKSKSVRRR